MAKQRLENCSVLDYLKKVHDVHVINTGASGVKVQNYPQNFRRTIASPPQGFPLLLFFFLTKISEGNFSILSGNQKEKKMSLPLPGTFLKERAFIPQPRDTGKLDTVLGLPYSGWSYIRRGERSLESGLCSKQRPDRWPPADATTALWCVPA